MTIGIVRVIATVLVCMVLTPTAVLAQAEPTPPARAPSIADFLADPALSHASLSPSGRYLVWVRRTAGASAIEVRDLDSDEVHTINADTSREYIGRAYVRWLDWKSDDRLLVSMVGFSIQRRGISLGETVVAMARDGSDMVEMQAPARQRARPGSVLNILPGDPDHVLMDYVEGFGGLSVARVNIHTGEAVQVVDGDRRILSYITDRAGTVVGRVAFRGFTGRVMVMEARHPDGRWSETFRIRQNELRDLPDFTFLGGTNEPSKVYVAVRPEASPDGGDTTALHEFDFRTRQLGPAIWRHGQYDVVGIVRDRDSGELLGGCYWADTYTCDFEDRRYASIIAGIRRFLGETWSVSVISQADDRSRLLLHVRAPNNPGGYYVYHAGERRMEPLGLQHPRLPEASLGEMRRIDFRADDGAALFGYLTTPPGITPGDRPPLIVMPHGGPEVRDHMDYELWVQFLATRGYQVFQPNFRGSSGMGQAFAEAGYGQWGARMQDDVTAGVQHLITQGLADPDRICIVGASYGGYAALWGGATQSELYRCVVSIAGISDLMEIMERERREYGGDSDRYEYWLRSIGNPRTERARLEETSPIRHVADWSLPTLLVHGEQDEVVPVAQSVNMARALERAGKPVRLVVLQGAGHSGWSDTRQTEFLTEIENFLRAHLPVTTPTK